MSQNRKCSSLQENGQRIEINFHRASKPAVVLMYQDFFMKKWSGLPPEETDFSTSTVMNL